jgi:hypothetical protein
MKILLPILLLLSLALTACNPKLSKYSKQIDLTKKLIACIKQNDTSCVKQMIGEGSEEWGFPNEDIVGFTTNGSELFKKASAAGVKKYKFKEYPETDARLVDILVPITGSGKKDHHMEVSFVKYIEEGKIFSFRFEFTRTKEDMLDVQIPTNPIPLIDSTK